MPESSSERSARGEMLRAIGQQLRWLSAYSVLFSHLQARRVGMNPTDLEAHDILTLAGPMPAGRLAALTGLTTGAVTSLIDRLEGAGLARREPDSTDRRRVIVRSLPPPPEIAQSIMPGFEAMGKRMDELLGRYDDAELTLIHDFLERSLAIGTEQISALGGSASAQAPDEGVPDDS